MPIFEYRCRDCDALFETIVAGDDSTPTCRHCDSPNLERQLSRFAVAGGSNQTLQSAPGPCGSCGAPQQGMCQMMN